MRQKIAHKTLLCKQVGNFVNTEFRSVLQEKCGEEHFSEFEDFLRCL